MPSKLLIGHDMAALVEDGRAVEIYPIVRASGPGEGAVHIARIVAVYRETASALLALADGQEAILPFKYARQQPVEGAALMVQIKKAALPSSRKRAVATSRPALVGRTVVVQPFGSGLAFSKRADWAEKEPAIRDQLRRIAKDAGLTVRTAALETSAENIHREAVGLMTHWQKTDRMDADAPRHLTAAVSPIEGLIRDHAPPAGDILIEKPALFAEARKIVKRLWPWLEDRLVRWKEPEPLFEAFGIQDAIERALSPRIPLPSGGWIRIDQTEALTAIDVNSGGAASGRGAAAMRLALNREAALEVAAQLRLQNIGGLIIVDFLDMKTSRDQGKVLNIFDRALAMDSRPVERTGFSRFGLVEVSRKRMGPNLREWMKK